MRPRRNKLKTNRNYKTTGRKLLHWAHMPLYPLKTFWQFYLPLKKLNRRPVFQGRQRQVLFYLRCRTRGLSKRKIYPYRKEFRKGIRTPAPRRKPLN